MSTYFTNPERPALAPQPQVAEKAAPAGGEAAKVEGLAKSVPAPAPVEAPKVATAPLAPQGEKPRTPAVAEMPAGAQMEQFSYATMEDNQVAPEDDLDLSTGDLDSILAGMSDQEKEIFLKKLHQKKRDGSCLESSLPISLA